MSEAGDLSACAPHHVCSKATSSGQATDLSATAFRQEEKRYKLYKPDPKAPKALRRRCDTDFTDVVDFRDISRNTETNKNMMRLVELQPNSQISAAYTFSGVPGLLFFPNAVCEEQQSYWCHQALHRFTQSERFPNNKSTLDANVSTSAYDATLRWATLGFKYDWTNRLYHKERWAVFPSELNTMMCSLVNEVAAVTQDQFSAAGLYESQTAIVNYFPVGTMMMAHQDVSEVCLEKPLMSMSLGCSCVFLMGTEKRDDKPFAFFLRSGDVVAFTGPSRIAYHAVPRILDDCPEYLLLPPPAVVAAPHKGQQQQQQQKPADREGDDSAAATSTSVINGKGNTTSLSSSVDVASSSWRGHMKGLRININVRQVYDESCPFLFAAEGEEQR
ncbi:2OG-Fe(II) oxygenase, putative [Bodo saltans]|uniref:2OG-Fe(II) oxygenase, putative n=1 Tax=Bodo saltans TaxID=75058 RepID=A0A0S4IYK4_BODSA|nr:2OG-Fe(II) oxygenase, putative [Bodo saltans]|eukprot:CUG56093.1 2OG-Fe(II) oxygenase, putative [Bodo saltans]